MRLNRLMNEGKFPPDMDKEGGRMMIKKRQGIDGPESKIDGKSKQSAKNFLYKAIKPFHINKIYHDEYWQGPQSIWRVFDQLNLNWQIDRSEYRKCLARDGLDPMVNCSKVWNFTIFFDNNRGKQNKLYGQLIASGAGSVEDPLEKYDMIIVIS